ncbi:protein TIC 62, chloroplastic-like isoform X2 [Arachis ipaensis]|uniref:protein TIC 62, chloroplastic-like isoform X2 n=1 Tax=Arachis ipaensis TaxID=130454 RepID=UPI000A2AFB4E|nr:protein TIC 62, chloroplastic-like isoform X2 [Arachis ipaensis]
MMEQVEGRVLVTSLGTNKFGLPAAILKHFIWGSSIKPSELMAVMAKNPDLAYCKIVEVVTETTAPLTPTEELLAKISSQRPYISSPKKPNAATISDPAPSKPAIATATEKETAQPKLVAKQSLSPYTV